MKLGIIQVASLGDIIIALPIARYYYEQGHEIHWPILDRYVAAFRETVPWVKWLPISPLTDDCMYEVPQRVLRERVEKTICLYHACANTPEFQPEPVPAAILKFDQYKYAVGKVPFFEKWNLSRCITRNHDREQTLFRKLVSHEPYLVLHLRGSDEARNFDVTPAVRRGYQIIEITELTDCFFDWLAILEGAGILVLIDSVFSNLVDQLGIGQRASKLFLRRSHNQVAWTPVMMGNWQYM